MLSTSVVLLAAFSPPSQQRALIDATVLMAEVNALEQVGEFERIGQLLIEANLDLEAPLLYFEAGSALTQAGIHEEGLSLLQRAAELGFGRLSTYLDPPELEPLRELPNWSELERTLEAAHASLEDPAAARIVTSDLPLFWKALERAKHHDDPASVFFDEYVAQGSPGLRDYYLIKLEAADKLVRATQAYAPRYYDFLPTLWDEDVISRYERRIRAAFRRLKDLYPPALFPPIYIVAGRMNSAGTVSETGLLISAEMFGRTPNTPMDELSNWNRDIMASFESLPFVVVHELIHYQQNLTAQELSLLDACIREGSCDFVASLCTNETPPGSYFDYGLEHELELWQEFQTRMHDPDQTGWLYGGDATRHRPADLGYFMGHRICKAYYESAQDKAAALAEILTTTDATELLQASGYDPK